ncbi:citrate lyase subunit alpha [Schnuerera sp. xch1]|uniref:citrate lyase subunit alpha n=1 Tax=Schnuerera sp. xch1 TaxID=2874283 RepID=UPI001CBF43EA|nr:citrate lyase subunit alpha [Schnuerera sp. xch1]
MKNSLGREIPETIKGYYKEVKPFTGAYDNMADIIKTQVRAKSIMPDEKKVLDNLEEVIKKSGLKDGMTISFHHHLRNGDYVVNMVMNQIASMGIKDIKIAASSIFPIHSPLIDHMKSGVVTGLYTSYMSGPVADAISEGILENPIIMHTHGGRSRAIESGDIKIDVAFIASSTCDSYGNINGVYGKSACGVLGYAISDAYYAEKVVAITDNLVSYPVCPIEISQDYVDYIVVVDKIGDPEGIVSGTTRITKDPIGLKIATLAAKVIEASGLLKDGFSFQTGAGGISLAVAASIREIMKDKNIKGSFMSGGITGYMVDMLEEGLFDSILDVQCFDLRAIESLKNNKSHQPMTATMYGNPHNKGAVVNNLDLMILGATEIDTDFNVNVTTGSNGIIMGGSGGHSDTAAGSKLAIVVSQLFKGRLPVIVDKVTTVSTPGETVDVLVTERGIAVNPKRQDLIAKLEKSKIKVMSIEKLKKIAEGITGKPMEIETDERIVAAVEYRDGTIIDIVKKIKR